MNGPAPTIAEPTEALGCRRFAIGDAMLLIVAISLWLALTRPFLFMMANGIRAIPYATLQTWGDWRKYVGSNPSVMLSLLLGAHILLIAMLVFVMPAWLLMRIRKPRPPLRRLMTQPGFVGSAPAAFLLLLFVLIAYGMEESTWSAAFVFWILVPLGCVVVPLSWMALWCSGRWRPERGWIDRLGWCLGVAFMVAVPSYLVLVRLVVS